MVNDIMKLLTDYDPEVGKAVEQEAVRQRRNLELIASENIVSEPVMMAMGTVLTNKYAEGYSGKRYYGGCEYVDVVETIAIERAKKLFGCEYGSVSGHAEAGGHGYGHEPESWRPSDTWKSGELFRTVLQYRALWGK